MPRGGWIKVRQTNASRKIKSSDRNAEKVYHLRISLLDFEPEIWRGVLVRGDTDLGTLHWVIQLAMGWTNSHMHQFHIGEERFSTARLGLEETGDEETVRLCDVAPKVRSWIIYEYDFGDSWVHRILVEKILEPDSAKIPVCVDGKRACPPEDVGGVWGYAEFLEAIHDPEHESHEEMLEWVGGSFDPGAFDLKQVNLRLKGLR